jgi:hypothetical protein
MSAGHKFVVALLGVLLVLSTGCDAQQVIGTSGAGGGSGSCTGSFCTATAPLAVSLGGTGISAFGTGVAAALGQNVSGTGSICLSSGSSCGGSGVPSIAGTANQITQTGSPGATTLSLPSNIIPPGTVNGNTVPSASDTFTLNAATQTLTNKSISGPQINSGTIPAAQLPLATTGAFGAVKPDGSSITVSAGVISSTGGSSGANPTATAGPTAVNGSATTFLRSDGAPAVQKASASQFGIVETDGSTITPTAGVIACTTATTSQLGCVKPDGSSITISAGVISSAGGASGANPTGTAGPTAVNGSATTFLRSDGAPAVQKASSAQFGISECDNSTITCSGGVFTATTGGGGSVTSVGTGAGLTGGPITGSGTISTTYAINAQTGTSYTFLTTDAATLVTFSNASSVAATLPVATTTGFGAGYSFDVENKGAGTVTITPTTSTINGAATLVVPQNTGCTVVSDGTNYQVSACTPASGTTGLGSFVRATSPTLVTPALGTIASGNLGSGTGYTISNLAGAGTGVLTALGNNVGSAGGPVTFNGAGGTPSSLALANGTGLPISTGVSGLGTGVATAAAIAVSGSGAICLVSGSACDTSGAGGTSGYSDNGVTVTAGTYFAPITGGGAPQGTEASVDVASPVAMTETDLQAAISTTLGVSSTGFTVTLRDNPAPSFPGASDTALTCTFNPSSATSCGDLTHSVSVALGDLIDWKIVTAGTIVGTPTITIASAQGTSTSLLSTANVWLNQQSNCQKTLTISSTTFTPDGTCNDYKITLTGSDTIANPSATPVVATYGSYYICQDATGSRTATWGSQFVSPGTVATNIVLSTTASVCDTVPYRVIDSTHILLAAPLLAATH